MYRRCLFCAADLGSNEVVEHFPIARRLAFDSAKGRLWAVCHACERWNLTPLEERWEALEQCERLMETAQLRAATDQITLARLSEGLDLVRIGRPLRAELAGWRYGDQFGRRRRRTAIATTATAVVVGGLAAGSFAAAGLGAAMLPLQLLNLVSLARVSRSEGIRFPSNTGELLRLTGQNAWAVKIRPHGSEWHLHVPHATGTDTIEGPEAVHALGLILPAVNRNGGSSRQIRAAAREIEDVGGADNYFREAEARARKSGHGYQTVFGLPARIRLALEIAANEASERAAAEGEVQLLEQAWRDAEEVAAISDGLLLPQGVTEAFQRLKERYGRANQGR